MRYRMSLLLSVLIAGILGIALPAPAYYETDSYNLERANISGYVGAVENQVAYIQTDSGDEIAVQLGPESYWTSNGYYLPEGEYVEMDVWYDPTDHYTEWYFVGEIWGSDFHYVLTNNEGVPYWVIFADDYYYSLGYRASCISYMIWFDCPPIYFVYLVLPPPPPLIYTCYYGSHWRYHHSDWHHGHRYCRGGSYWTDGRGYERPSHRSGRRARNYDRWEDGRGAGKSSVKPDNVYKRSEPSTPVIKPQPPKGKLQRQPAKPQRIYDRSTTARKDYRSKSVTTKPSPERKEYTPKSEPQKHQIQSRSSDRSKQSVRESNVIRSKAPHEQSKPQITKQQSRTSSSERSDSAGKRGNDFRKGKR